MLYVGFGKQGALRVNNKWTRALENWALLNQANFYLALSATELWAIVSRNLQRVQIENITLCIDSEISLSFKCNQSLSDRPLNWNKSHKAGRNHRHCAWLCHLIGLKRIPIYSGWLIAPLPQIKECGVCTGLFRLKPSRMNSHGDLCWFAEWSHLLYLFLLRIIDSSYV